MKQINIHNFRNIVKEIDKVFTEISNKLNLEEVWNSNNCLNIEIKKSYIKSILRYMQLTEDLLNNICSIHKKKNNQNFQYTSLYPMLHLSNDRVESGGYHFDQVDNVNIITLWIAITKYEYPALSLLKYNFKNKFLNKIIINLNLAKYFSESILVDQGDLSCWDGKLIHSGNLNISKKPALAFQMKILPENKNFLFEDLRNFNNPIKIEQFIDFKNLNLNINNFQLFLNLVNQVLKLSNSKNSIYKDFEKVIEVLELLKIKDILTNKILSFSLSILSQRIRSHKKFFDSTIENHDKFCSLIDFCSLIIGAENLVSFKRLYLENKKIDFLEYIMKKDIFGVCLKKRSKFVSIIKSI